MISYNRTYVKYFPSARRYGILLQLGDTGRRHTCGEDMTEIREESGADLWSIRVAFFAGTCHLVSWLLLNYQAYLAQTRVRPFVISYPLLISECFYLTPLFALIAFRRSRVVVVG